MIKCKVLKMEKSDVDEVFEIEKLVHPNHHWSKDAFYNELANKLSVYYCAKIEEKITGYIGIWKIIDEAHITTLAVHPEFFRLNIAKALMCAIIQECYKSMIKYITLEVRESNTAAINLYEKFSFDSIGIRKKYYQDNGENALIMFTQNIWYDKFKNNFEKIKKEITKIEVEYD